MKSKVIFLKECDPDPPQGGNWILIEEDSTGKWYGTGFGINNNGEELIYISDFRDDIDYLSSKKSAIKWAEQHNVSVIYVRRICPSRGLGINDA